MFSFKTYSEAAFNVGYNSSKDADIQKLISFLQGNDKDEIVLVSTQDGKSFKIKRAFQDKQKDIKKFIDDNNLNIKLASQMFGDGSIGTGGKKVPGEVQEMITACLVLLNFNKTTISQEEAIDLIEKCKEIYSKVDGADKRPEFLDFFHGNFSDLASAISAANYILDEVGTAKKVYWTGKGWDKTIAHFNPSIGNIKDYNSSDIVVENNTGKFFGYSLKKKATTKSPDPTLINKPVTGNVSFLENIIGKPNMILINNAKPLQISVKKNLKNIIKKKKKFQGSIEIEIFSSENLFYPFPALVANFNSKNSSSFVHSLGRTFNNLYDKQNAIKFKVPETGFDILPGKDTKPFMAFTNGNNILKNQTIKFKIISEKNQIMTKFIKLKKIKPYETNYLFFLNDKEKEKIKGKSTVFIYHNFNNFFPRCLWSKIY